MQFPGIMRVTDTFESLRLFHEKSEDERTESTDEFSRMDPEVQPEIPAHESTGTEAQIVKATIDALGTVYPPAAIPAGLVTEEAKTTEFKVPLRAYRRDTMAVFSLEHSVHLSFAFLMGVLLASSIQFMTRSAPAQLPATVGISESAPRSVTQITPSLKAWKPTKAKVGTKKRSFGSQPIKKTRRNF